MIKITIEKLEEFKACEEGKNWFLNQKLKSLSAVCKSLLKQNAYYATWILPRYMDHTQQVQFAIFCAEQTIKIFESKYPTDKRPRLAIQAAKDFLAGKSTAYAAANAANAAYAAHAAANAAGAADAAYAADAAADAAYAADAAADAASDATYAAADAANAAATWSATSNRKKLTTKIISFGLKILGEK